MDAVLTLPYGRPLTRADLDELPDDGHRYELIDGILVVSPAPGHLHQRVVVRLVRLLDEACPRGQEVLTGPFDIVLADDTLMQPDILVARRADITRKDLPAPPLLAVEVLSPSTRRFDLMLKRSRFESAGTQSYWVIDPNEPSLIAWQLQPDGYAEAAHVTGSEAFMSDEPFRVTVVPQLLVAER